MGEYAYDFKISLWLFHKTFMYSMFELPVQVLLFYSSFKEIKIPY